MTTEQLAHRIVLALGNGFSIPEEWLHLSLDEHNEVMRQVDTDKQTIQDAYERWKSTPNEAGILPSFGGASYRSRTEWVTDLLSRGEHLQALLGMFYQTCNPSSGEPGEMHDGHLSDYEHAGALLVEAGLLERIGEDTHRYRLTAARSDPENQKSASP